MTASLSSRTLLFVSSPDTAIDTSSLNAARVALGDCHMIDDRRLSPESARELRVAAPEDMPLYTLSSRIGTAIGAAAVDIAVIPDDLAFRRMRHLVADMESTIIEQEMIDELAERAGFGGEISALTARTMGGELPFELSLLTRVAMLAGLDAHLLDEIYDTRVTVIPGAETLVKTMQANDAHCALVSDEFFAEPTSICWL